MNAGTFLTLVVVVAICALIIHIMRKDKKKGGCSGNCCSCSCSACHKK